MAEKKKYPPYSALPPSGIKKPQDIRRPAAPPQSGTYPGPTSVRVGVMGSAPAEVKKPAATPQKSTRVTPGSALSHDQIAARARTIWQAKGCRPGQDVQNWLEAEAQLKSEMGMI